MDQHLPAIIVVTPLSISFLIFFFGWWRRQWSFPLAIVGVSVCLAAAAAFAVVAENGTIRYQLGGWPPPVGIEVRLDMLAAFMLVLITFMAWLTAWYSRKIADREIPDKTSLFWSLYMLLVTGLLGIVVTGDVFNLFVLLEVASLSGYALVAVGGNDALVAGFRYLVIGTIGASFYLFGVGLLYMATGSLNMEDLRILLPALYGSRMVRAAFIFIFIGFSVKIALFPLHTWQPDAYTHSPSAVSVIISTAVAKTFAYAMIRIVFSVFTVDFLTSMRLLTDMISWMAVVSVIVGSLYAIVQTNLKRMLAYSSVANVGYIVLAVGLAPSSSLGISPAIVHLLNHAVMKGCMFMAACGFIYQYGLFDINRFTGLGRRMPATCTALVLASLAMIGMPPGGGFVTKWYLIQASLESGKTLFVAAIFTSSLLMIVYFWRLIEVMMIRTEDAGRSDAVFSMNDLPAGMRNPCLALGILSVAAGVLWMSGAMHPVLASINAGFGLGGKP